MTGCACKWDWIWSKWEEMQPKVEGRRIAAGPDGLPWVVTEDHQVYKYEEEGLVHIPAPDAHDLSVAPNGNLFITTTTHMVCEYLIDEDAWLEYPYINARRIAVDNLCRPCVVSMDHKIFIWNQGKWHQLPGEARDIGAGNDGSLSIISTIKLHHSNYEIMRWNYEQ